MQRLVLVKVTWPLGRVEGPSTPEPGCCFVVVPNSKLLSGFTVFPNVNSIQVKLRTGSWRRVGS